MTPEQRVNLLNAVTEHDRREATKKHHNRFALAMYARAIGNAAEDMQAHGWTIREALVQNFNGRLLDCVLKAVGEPKFTREEQMRQRICR